jgi:hypothetical protein
MRHGASTLEYSNSLNKMYNWCCFDNICILLFVYVSRACWCFILPHYASSARTLLSSERRRLRSSPAPSCVLSESQPLRWVAIRFWIARKANADTVSGGAEPPAATIDRRNICFSPVLGVWGDSKGGEGTSSARTSLSSERRKRRSSPASSCVLSESQPLRWVAIRVWTGEWNAVREDEA